LVIRWISMWHWLIQLLLFWVVSVFHLFVVCLELVAYVWYAHIFYIQAFTYVKFVDDIINRDSTDIGLIDYSGHYWLLKLEFDDENNTIKLETQRIFGGDWKSFCNARQLQVGKRITLGTSSLGDCATLYCTFDVWDSAQFKLWLYFSVIYVFLLWCIGLCLIVTYLCYFIWVILHSILC